MWLEQNKNWVSPPPSVANPGFCRCVCTFCFVCVLGGRWNFPTATKKRRPGNCTHCVLCILLVMPLKHLILTGFWGRKNVSKHWKIHGLWPLLIYKVSELIGAAQSQKRWTFEAVPCDTNPQDSMKFLTMINRLAQHLRQPYKTNVVFFQHRCSPEQQRNKSHDNTKMNCARTRRRGKILTLTVLVTTIDALRHFETG